MTRSTRTTTASADGLLNPQSILSRFASPFASRKRNLAEYYIRAKEPHRQYSPGDKVEGTVVLTVTKPLRLSHLVVCLHGFVKVFTSTRSPGQSVSRDGGLLGGGIGKRGSAYFGDGFASLFENEIALCGEGRLEPGSYEFQFCLELPSKGIPSSISFERGTISYMITSTLTRPTTISPTTTCERQIQFVETVDIAPILPPKPRMVSVETLSRKSISKMSMRDATTSSAREKSPQSSKADARKLSPRSTISTAPTLNKPPSSPARSELSSASMQSSTASSRHTGLLRLPSKSSNGSDGVISSVFASAEIVTATIHLLHGGCLPGDKLPLEISIQHNRPVKSLQGIIITLYREGHVDTHPAIPLGPMQPGKEQEYEDYYPKSRTGLGGLSLSSAGSSSGFRKNLSQKIVPLIVDPQSLHATMKTYIQVPEDLFPTISSVPGAMITFKYFMEVVIDLGGKLPSQDRFLPRLNMTSWASRFEYSDYMGNKMDASESLAFPFVAPLNFLNTEGVRREKGVVACLFEVIVGTRDSRRNRLRQVENHFTRAAPSSDNQRRAEDRTENMSNISPVRQPPREPPMIHEALDGSRDSGGRFDALNETTSSQSYIAPLPELEEDLDEKARMRRAEQQLLPSAPFEDAAWAANNADEEPSAPRVFDSRDLYLVQGGTRADAPAYDSGSATLCEGESSSNIRHNPTEAHMGNRVPPMAELGEDKLELERRRLETEVSSPDDSQGSNEVGRSSHGQQPAHPTSSGLDEEFPYRHYDPHESQVLPSRMNAISTSGESLPSYEK